MAWSTQAAAMHGNNLSVGEYKKPLFLTIGVTFWAVRLAGFLFYRVLQTGKDSCVLLASSQACGRTLSSSQLRVMLMTERIYAVLCFSLVCYPAVLLRNGRIAYIWRLCPAKVLHAQCNNI